MAGAARTREPGRADRGRGGIAASAAWAYVLLNRTPDWLPWLRWVVLVAGAAAAGLVLAAPWLAGLARSRRGRLALAALPLGLALVAGLAGPTAYALDTVNSAHAGAIPSAGPQSAGFGGGPGGRGGFPGAAVRGFGRGTAGTGARADRGGTGTRDRDRDAGRDRAPGGTRRRAGRAGRHRGGAEARATAFGGGAGWAAAPR